MSKMYYARWMYPCGVIPRWDGTAVDLETDTERAAKEKAAKESLTELRTKYVTAFKGLRWSMQRFDPWSAYSISLPLFLPVNDMGFDSVSFSSISRATHSAIGESETVARDVTLPGGIGRGDTPAYPLGVNAGQRDVGSIATNQPAGAVTEITMRLESEPSSAKAHAHNLESAGIDQRAYVENVKNTFWTLPVCPVQKWFSANAFAGYFYADGKEHTFWNSYNLSYPYSTTQDNLTGSSFIYMHAEPSVYVQPHKWNLLQYVIAHKTVQAWESVDPSPVQTEDLRDYFSIIDDLALFPIQRGSTRQGFLHFAPADIGYLVGDQYNPTDGFFKLINVTSAIFAEGKYRDRDGTPVEIYHSNFTSGMVITHDKFMTSLHRNVLQSYRLNGPYTDIDQNSTHYAGLNYTPEGYRHDFRQEVGENIRVREYSSGAPPVLTREYTYPKGTAKIIPPPFDSFSAILRSDSDRWVMSPHRIGFSGSTPCVPYAQFFEEIPSGAVLCTEVQRGIEVVGYKPPGYQLQPGETWNNAHQAWSSPDVSVLNDPNVVWYYPNANTVQITAKTGIGYIEGYGTNKNEMVCFTLWKDGSSSPEGFDPDLLAFVIPANWSGYVIPYYGDFVSASINSSSQTPPSASLEPQGSVRLQMNNCADYEVHILEFSDGNFPVRIPIYRAPEKLLNKTTSNGVARNQYAPTVSPIITGRMVTVDLPQPIKIFVSKVPWTTTQSIAATYKGIIPLVSYGAEEIPDGIIPDRYTGTVYVQVVDTYYCEMQEITVNL